jgi:hypothetical protein
MKRGSKDEITINSSFICEGIILILAIDSLCEKGK